MLDAIFAGAFVTLIIFYGLDISKVARYQNEYGRT